MKAKGASLKEPEQAIDTGTAAGKRFLESQSLIASFASGVTKDIAAVRAALSTRPTGAALFGCGFWRSMRP
jgi:hypothetical protein